MVESIVNKMDFTIHIREANPSGKYKINTIIFYTDLETFQLGERDTAPAHDILSETRQEVDRFESEFTIEPEEG